MQTFLAKIPQSVPFDDLLAMDPSLDSAVRDVAQSNGMPAANGVSALLESLAAVQTAQMLHDGDTRDSFLKGVIRGLLIGAALPTLCHDFVRSKQQPQPQKEGPQ